MRRISPIVILLFSLSSGTAQGQVYNLRLVTDNQPDYTDMKSFVESSTGAWQTPKSRSSTAWASSAGQRKSSCLKSSDAQATEATD